MFSWFGKKRQPEALQPLRPLHSFVHDYEAGDRVKVRQTAGFHKGAHGSVTSVEPGGYQRMYPDGPPYDLVWVERDGAGSSVWYLPQELDHHPIPVSLELNRELTFARPSHPSI